MTTLLFAGVVGLCAAGFASAQTIPVADGTIGTSEYAFDKSDGPAHLYWRFDSDHIYLALVGQTRGWVAIGVDSNRMNGAKIFMGYVADGKEAFTTQRGLRHSHSESSAFSALSHGLTEQGGVTSLEIVLDRASFLGAGQSSLDVIYAMGSSDSFRQYHSFRGTAVLDVR